MATRGQNVPHILVLFFIQLAEHALQKNLGKANNGIEGGTELMGHVGEKLRLVAAGGLELSVLLFDFVEESDVLNRNYCLIREGCHQLNLPVSEGLDFAVPDDREGAEQVVPSYHWDAEHSPSGFHMPRPKGVFGVGQDVVNMNRPPL